MEGQEVGKVFNYFDHVGVAAVELLGDIKLGDTLRFFNENIDFTEVIDSIQIERSKVDSAKAGDKVGLKISEKVSKGTKVFKVL